MKCLPVVGSSSTSFGSTAPATTQSSTPTFCVVLLLVGCCSLIGAGRTTTRNGFLLRFWDVLSRLHDHCLDDL